MEQWKKYEGYENNERKYVINFNKGLMKRILSLTVAGVIEITTLTGCSLGSKQKPTITEPPKIEYTSVDEEIMIKQEFINDAFNKVYAYAGQHLYDIIYRQTKTDYAIIAENQEKLDPNSKLGMERKYFYPELSDNELKEEIANSYGNIIEKIEIITDAYVKETLMPEIDYYNYVTEYQEENKQYK